MKLRRCMGTRARTAPNQRVERAKADLSANPRDRESGVRSGLASALESREGDTQPAVPVLHATPPGTPGSHVKRYFRALRDSSSRTAESSTGALECRSLTMPWRHKQRRAAQDKDSAVSTEMSSRAKASRTRFWQRHARARVVSLKGSLAQKYWPVLV